MRNGKGHRLDQKEILESMYSVFPDCSRSFLDTYGVKFSTGMASLNRRLDAPEKDMHDYLQDFRKKTGRPEAMMKDTGTTLVALVYRDGVIMGADRKTSAGDWTYGLEAKKIVKISPTIALAGTGLVPEINLVKEFLMEYRTWFRSEYDEEISVEQLSKVFYWMSQNVCESAYLMGGFSGDGIPMLYDLDTFYRESVSQKAHGSGGFTGHASGVLEADYKRNMTEEQAMKLIVKALVTAEKLDHFSGTSNGEYQIIKFEKGKPLEELPVDVVRAMRVKYLKEMSKE